MILMTDELHVRLGLLLFGRKVATGFVSSLPFVKTLSIDPRCDDGSGMVYLSQTELESTLKNLVDRGKAY